MFIVGKWKGEGTVNAKVKYIELLEINPIKPNLYSYQQKTLNKETQSNYSI